MSHFTVMIIGNDPEVLLQPFHEYECTGIEDEYVKFVPAEEDLEEEFKDHKDDYETIEDFARNYYGYEKNDDGVWGRITNPNAKWDWYQLGGRWTGEFLRLKEGQTGVEGEASWANKGSRGIDSALLGDIDFEAKRVEAEATARERYKEVMGVFNHVLPVLDHEWKDLMDETKPEYVGLSIEEKRTMYHAQSAMVKVSENSEVLGFFFEISDFDCTEDEFALKARKDACSTFAVIKDGKWYERGQMGWWACVSDEKDGKDWNKEVDDLLDGVSDDTLISIYDCHI